MATLNQDLAKATGDPTLTATLKEKMKEVEAELKKDEKLLNDGEQDLQAWKTQIMTKTNEIKQLVRFVKLNCQEADQAESEVKEVINMITQVEVTNRLYYQYVKVIEIVSQ